MGEQDIASAHDEEQRRAFMKALLEDVQALERMLEEGRIESGIRRIGAEQELFLVDAAMQPAGVALEVLEELGLPDFTTELGRFNLEANLDPCELSGDCLSRMESALHRRVGEARDAAARFGAKVALVGILPTLAKEHLSLDWMTPKARYRELNRTMSELRGGVFKTLIKGLDELQVEHDNVMLEACNTSFQIHFQVGAEEFAGLYNLAQAVTGPVMAAAVNSPLLLSNRLWHETRVALFQQSLDARSKAHQARGSRQRVSFGEHWLKEGVLEIFREDIARFRVLIAGELDEPPLDVLDRGEVPKLSALCLHNGTVYRWNRPCYGVKNGVAHLRIENRVLPAGPTVVDEVANAAFFFGLMTALGETHGDVSRVMDFDHAKENFMAASRYGLKARFQWLHGKSFTADELILERLIPAAREGLAERGVNRGDVDRYLGVLEERVRRGRTGSQWALDSLAAMNGRGTRHARERTLVRAMVENQEHDLPVARWPLAELADRVDWLDSYRTVGQVMQTDLFTVHPEDLIDLAASLMDWEHIRHVPVEDHDGRLVGVVSHRRVLRMVGRGLRRDEALPVSVREVMKPDPVSVTQETSTLDAIETMRKHGVSCLPVVSDDGQLVGIVTEHDFIEVAANLLEEKLREG